MSGERALRVAVVGATDLVGREIVSLLDERGFPLTQLLLYGPQEAEGEEVGFRDGAIRVERLPDPMPRVDVVFLCATSDVGAELGPAAVATGALTIDLAPRAVADALAPPVLGVGDLPPTVRRASGGLLVRMADPMTRLAAVPLRALGTLGRLERVIGTFLVCASASGRERVERLSEETINLLNLREPGDEQPSPELAFRCVPERSSSTKCASDRIAREISGLLGGAPRVLADIVEVPAFFGHAVSLAIELQSAVGADQARAALRETPSVLVVEGAERLSTVDVVGTDAIFIVDVRQLAGDERWLHFWALSDNVRQGAALPAVAIAESLLGDRGPGAG